MRQRLGSDGEALGMLSPFVSRSHLGGASPRLNDRFFQVAFGPASNRSRHGVFLGVSSQHAFGCRAMMRCVRVKSNPAIACAIVAGDRIPGRWELPPDRTNG